MTDKNKKCWKCRNRTKQAHARYPISNPDKRNHVPIGFMELCKDCSKIWKFAPDGELILRN